MAVVSADIGASWSSDEPSLESADIATYQETFRPAKQTAVQSAKQTACTAPNEPAHKTAH